MQVSESGVPGWRAWALSDRGLLRSENQDAWAVVWDREGPRGRCHVFAVFDGVGGLPRGAEAANRAAEALREQFAAGPVEGLLARMNPVVRDTGGGTTAVVAVVSATGPSHWDLLSAGDSSVYRLDGSGVESVAPRDAGRGNEIRDFLGNPNLVGHAVQVAGEGAESLLLCTDGVDKVVDEPRLVEVLRASPEATAGALRDLMAEVHARGAPDNATVVVVRRVA